MQLVVNDSDTVYSDSEVIDLTKYKPSNCITYGLLKTSDDERSCCFPSEYCGTADKVNEFFLKAAAVIANVGAFVGIGGMFFDNAPVMFTSGVIIFVGMITGVAGPIINRCRQCCE